MLPRLKLAQQTSQVVHTYRKIPPREGAFGMTWSN
jgi:hypothetical protein